jgi:exosortase/archaeosortase family protein
MKEKKVEKTLKSASEEKKKQDIDIKKIVLFPLIKTFVLWLILLTLVHFFAEFLGPVLIHFTGYTVMGFSKILFIPAYTVDYKVLDIFSFPIHIVVECTAYNYYLFILSLVIFAKWNIRDKIINFFILFFSIMLANILRFIILALVGRYYINFFNLMHDYFWNVLFAILTLAIWLVLNEKSQNHYLNKITGSVEPKIKF